MARGGRHNRFTVFDVLDQKGVFEENPANPQSNLYMGPIEYPKMFYHPTGKRRIVQKAEILATPMGPMKVGEQFEMISRVVNTPEDERRAREAGWHDHPAKAIEAGGEHAPPMTAHGRIADLERQLLILQGQLAAARAAPPPEVDEYEFEIERTA